MFKVEGKTIQASSLKAIRNKIRHTKQILDSRGDNIVGLLTRGATLLQEYPNGTVVKYKVSIEKYTGVGYGSKPTNKALGKKRSSSTYSNATFIMQ